MNTALKPARYASVYDDRLRRWQIVDSHTKAHFGNFDTKFQADKRITALQIQENRRTRTDYGMKHPVPAPAPRAFKD